MISKRYFKSRQRQWMDRYNVYDQKEMKTVKTNLWEAQAEKLVDELNKVDKQDSTGV